MHSDNHDSFLNERKQIIRTIFAFAENKSLGVDLLEGFELPVLQ